MTIYKKAVLPLGFKANGFAAGIKRSGKLDLALIYSGPAAKAASLFTSNKIQAAPVKISRKHLKENKAFRAVIINSGNANCFTGEAGLKDARDTAAALSGALGVKKAAVLVASTGIIGRRLPFLKIKDSIPDLIKGLSTSGIHKAKKAILTTDTFPKEITAKFKIGGRTITLCGIAKGSGMIAPDVATMLCFIMTDALITQRALRGALKECARNSFNCVTVDGCMSTNDTVTLLANGAGKNPLIDTGNKYYGIFHKVLNSVCLELAKLLVRDAEGATKFIQIKVEKAKSFNEAKKAALFIANSNLFKTAVYGQNPNFGRIIAAVGASGIVVSEKGIKVKVSPLARKDVYVTVTINKGNSSAVVFTSDLTPEYIKINAEYN